MNTQHFDGGRCLLKVYGFPLNIILLASTFIRKPFRFKDIHKFQFANSGKKKDSFLEEGAERIHTHQFLGSLVNDEIPKVASDLRLEVVGIKVKQKIL